MANLGLTALNLTKNFGSKAGNLFQEMQNATEDCEDEKFNKQVF
jgi:hypothetical protein